MDKRGRGRCRQRSEGVALRAEARPLGLAITNHVTFGPAPFLLWASVSSPVKQATSLSCLFHQIFGKKVPLGCECQSKLIFLKQKSPCPESLEEKLPIPVSLSLPFQLCNLPPSVGTQEIISSLLWMWWIGSQLLKFLLLKILGAFFFSRAHSQHMEVPRLGDDESEL